MAPECTKELTVETNRNPSRIGGSVIRKAAGVWIFGAAALTGCNNAVEGGVTGGAIGALGGLAIGSLTGSAGAGAAIGAVSGAIGGAVIGDQNERRSQGR